MSDVQCNACGSTDHEERRTDYLYRRTGRYLLVPNTPVEVCLSCGTVYYAASVLKEIERRFIAIYEQGERPDRYVEMPATSFA